MKQSIKKSIALFFSSNEEQYLPAVSDEGHT